MSEKIAKEQPDRSAFHLLVFQHVAAEHLGRFGDLFAKDNTTVTVVKLDQGDKIPSLEGIDGIWALGGPMQVWQEDEYPWLVDEKAAIREAVVERKLPYFGLCLGHQLLADALGGTVAVSETPEVGVMPVHLTEAGKQSNIFHGIKPTISCTQGHGAEVVKAPHAAEILAESPDCGIQALGINGNAFSIQFHSELTLEMVDACLELPGYKEDFDALLGTEGIAAFRKDVDSHSDRHDKIAKILYENWRRIAVPKNA